MLHWLTFMRGYPVADSVSSGALVVTPQSGSKGSGSKKPGSADADLRHHLAAECDAMARHAFARGLQMPSSVLQSLDFIEQTLDDTLESASLEQLGQLHMELSDVVAPAMPQTIYLLQRDKSQGSWLASLGPLPAIRRLLLATLLFTLTFVLVSTSGEINHENMARDIYSMNGLALLEVLVFLMSAAGMGACFHALFVAHTYIGDGTYDPRYDSSYWTRIGLGVIAGLIMSQLIPIGPDAEAAAAGVAGAGAGDGAPVMSKPILALLGGFSATMVYTVLERLVETVESLFKGKPGASQKASDHSSARAADRHRRANGYDGSTPRPRNGRDCRRSRSRHRGRLHGGSASGYPGGLRAAGRGGLGPRRDARCHRYGPRSGRCRGHR
jgi:hypothetical protein